MDAVILRCPCGEAMGDDRAVRWLDGTVWCYRGQTIFSLFTSVVCLACAVLVRRLAGGDPGTRHQGERAPVVRIGDDLGIEDIVARRHDPVLLPVH